MTRPHLHIQNVYDVLNPTGHGVNGYLKLKCIQIQNRVVAMAEPGDIATISADCPQAYVDYMLGVTGSTGATILRYEIHRDLRRYLNAHAVFEALKRNPLWIEVVKMSPKLDAYCQTRPVFIEARCAGIEVAEDQWTVAVSNHLTEQMNDKAILYRYCQKAGIPTPKSWIFNHVNLIGRVIDLLDSGLNRLYIRQARSSGSLGNVTVEKTGDGYIAHELDSRTLSTEGLNHILEHFIKTSYWDEYVVSEFLDLYASPGTLFYVGDTDTRIVCHTAQILNASRKFHGSMYPIIDEFVTRHTGKIERHIKQILEPWRLQGYRGYANIDWMVTKAGESFIAELNARETAAVPPIRIENVLSGKYRYRQPMAQPSLAFFARDKVNLLDLHTFEDVYHEFSARNLLWHQRNDGTGVVILVPPLPAFGINTAGIVALGPTLPAAFEIFAEATQALGDAEQLLFEMNF